VIQIFYSKKVPLLQNTVYLDQISAKTAPYGTLNITMDNKQFVFNSAFDPRLMVYDKSYDNSVPSKVFISYYDGIIDYLASRYNLRSGNIIEIGCGKGTFLTRTASRYKNINCLGIDPSYEGSKTSHNGRVKFINEYFKKEHINNINLISLILLRHTLEHIPSPIDFLKNIFHIFKYRIKSKTLPVFIEVPDFMWTLKNDAFMDFCYEHVNYFTEKSISDCISAAGAHVTNITKAFKNQYIWAECTINSDRFTKAHSYRVNDPDLKDKNFFTHFKNNLKTIINKIKILKINKKTVIWGMATKGVMFSLHLLNNHVEVDYCIDINRNKQGKYAPLSGYQISSPNCLVGKNNYAIICMNQNYAKEVHNLCRNLKVNHIMYDAEINEICL